MRSTDINAHETFENGTVSISSSSWWQAQAAPDYAPLDADIEADIAVVGAGLAGASVALHLAERGIKTVLLEALQPANGASGRNAGHVQAYLDDIRPLQSWPDRGEKLLDYFINHRNIVFDMCRKHNIFADQCHAGAIELAGKGHKSLYEKQEFWRRKGYDVSVVTGDELKERVRGHGYTHGLYWRDGGRVNPYLFTTGMVRVAAGLGARVFGNSPVLSCEKQTGSWRLQCPRGTVNARKVVLCTNGHWGNRFFPILARTQYPLVACALATNSVPSALLDEINPTRAALTQYPLGLYPLIMDGRDKMITATIPFKGDAANPERYFNYFLKYLGKAFPVTRDFDIRLENYWTGVTASSSHVYHQDYAKLYRPDEDIFALMNIGTWGNVMGPLLGMNLAHALAEERYQDLVLPVEKPRQVYFQGLLDLKIKRLLVPLSRAAERLGVA